MPLGFYGLIDLSKSAGALYVGESLATLAIGLDIFSLRFGFSLSLNNPPSLSNCLIFFSCKLWLPFRL